VLINVAPFNDVLHQVQSDSDDMLLPGDDGEGYEAAEGWDDLLNSEPEDKDDGSGMDTEI
jgi:hypothetical protein